MAEKNTGFTIHCVHSFEFGLVKEGKEGIDCSISFRLIRVDGSGLKSPCGGRRPTLLLLGETFLTPPVLEGDSLETVSGITSSQGVVVFSNLGSASV